MRTTTKRKRKKKVPKIRRFGGKPYRLAAVSRLSGTTKSDARATAEFIFAGKGFLYRVVQIGRKYFIYARAKRR